MALFLHLGSEIAEGETPVRRLRFDAGRAPNGAPMIADGKTSASKPVTSRRAGACGYLVVTRRGPRQRWAAVVSGAVAVLFAVCARARPTRTSPRSCRRPLPERDRAAAAVVYLTLGAPSGMRERRRNYISRACSLFRGSFAYG
jgi:hypothetical protein